MLIKSGVRTGAEVISRAAGFLELHGEFAAPFLQVLLELERVFDHPWEAEKDGGGRAVLRIERRID
jgi:hypothetical protein